MTTEKYVEAIYWNFKSTIAELRCKAAFDNSPFGFYGRQADAIEKLLESCSIKEWLDNKAKGTEQ